MTRPDRKKGSVIPVKKTRSRDGTRLKNNDRPLIILLWISILLIIVDVIITGVSYCYAARQDQLSAWMTYYSSTLSSIAGIIIGSECLTSIISLCLSENALWHKGTFLALSITLFFYASGGALAVGSAVHKQPDETTVVGPVQTSQKASDGLLKKPYILEDDFFMEDLEAYLGVEKGTVLPNDIITQMAVLLTATLTAEKEKAEQEKPSKTEEIPPPKAYETYTAFADQNHETYKEQHKRDWSKKDDVGKLLREERKEDLQSVIDARIMANNTYKDSGNMQQIAMYCKEYGDEYLAEGDSAAAMAQYKEGTIWCMRAFCAAWIAGTDTSIIMFTFDTLDEAVNDKLFENMDTGQEIHKSYKAYKIVEMSQ